MYILSRKCAKYTIAISMSKSLRKLIILVRNFVDSLFLRARTYLPTYLSL